LQATLPRPVSGIRLSGIARIKNVDGSIEYPSELTPSGFVTLFVNPGGVSDVPFAGNATVDQWAFFPASPDQEEFLFEVIPPSSNPTLSFRIIVKDNKFVIIKASPATDVTALQFTKAFSGTIGAESKVHLQLTNRGSELSCTEQYARVGKTLWLKGAVDSLGNFVLKEYYPKEQVTGIFQGKFSQNYGTMTGYFSKPDGSRLQPFEFREAGAPSRSAENGSDSRAN
jgi:hypothetical protein